MKLLTSLAVGAITASLLVGCGEAQGTDLSKTAPQPTADLEAGKNATTIDEWAKANPNNGAPGHWDAPSGK